MPLQDAVHVAAGGPGGGGPGLRAAGGGGLQAAAGPERHADAQRLYLQQTGLWRRRQHPLCAG